MTPKKIALLTDSSADLRWDQARENNIFFVPLRILCEDGEYLDGVNITGPDIYQRLHNGELPQTSLPRVEDFSAKLREIFDLGYDGVIAVMLSSGLSGTYNLARILAGECAEQGYAMKVFDSVSGALGQGMTVLQLAEDIKNGMDWEELTERRAPQLIANTYPFFSVDTLEYLVKGGRIGKVTAMAGTMLQIKPIITFAPDGQLQSVAKVRGRHQVMRKLVDMAVDRCGEHKRYNLAVANGGSPEEMETVADADRGTTQQRPPVGRRDRRHPQRLHRRRCAGRCRSGAGLTKKQNTRNRHPASAGCLSIIDKMAENACKTEKTVILLKLEKCNKGGALMLDIFEILGPIMVGPSSSHTAGAVRIGRMARTLLGEPPVKADIGLYGSFAETGRGHGTDRALVAGLLGMKPDDLRIPESFSVAKEQGLSFVFHPAELREAHPNTAVLTVEGASGKKTKVQAASIGGGRIRVDQLDGVAVDFTGIFNTLIVRHMDVPGELATLTKVLSDGGINIANMSLVRDRRGGSVMTIFEIDQPVPAAELEQLKAVPQVLGVIYYEKEDD